MTRLTLYWELRSLDMPCGRDVAGRALCADDTIQFLDRVRNDPVEYFEDRIFAAELLTRHLWPDEKVSRNWHGDYVKSTREIEALKRMGEYHPPDKDGYHHGGVFIPEIPSAEPLTCPNCLHKESFWDFDVDSESPELRCACGWEPTTA